MAVSIQFRRGVQANRLTITPLAGEPILTTDLMQLFIGDGATAGGVDVVGNTIKNASIIFTNKTIDADNNTILDLGVENFDPASVNSDNITSNDNITLATTRAIRTYVASGSVVFTNKTFDVNGTGNSLVNVELPDFAAGVIDDDITLAADSSSKLATQHAVKQFVQSYARGTSWRPPVEVMNSASTARPIGNPVVTDGITIQAGNRVLYTALSNAGDNNRVYRAVGTTTNITSWTLELDGQAGTGAPTDGDAVFVRQGTAYADIVTHFNGTAWVQTGSIPAGALLAANNLADLQNIATARVNLGGANGAVVTLNGNETLTAKTINAASNTISGLTEINLKTDVAYAGRLLTWGVSGVPAVVAKGTTGQYLTVDANGVPIFASVPANLVSGPASSVDEAIARFDGTTGKILQTSPVTITDGGVVNGAIIDGGSF